MIRIVHNFFQVMIGLILFSIDSMSDLIEIFGEGDKILFAW
jgi:hypothetical protein